MITDPDADIVDGIMLYLNGVLTSPFIVGLHRDRYRFFYRRPAGKTTLDWKGWAWWIELPVKRVFAPRRKFQGQWIGDYVKNDSTPVTGFLHGVIDHRYFAFFTEQNMFLSKDPSYRFDKESWECARSTDRVASARDLRRMNNNNARSS